MAGLFFICMTDPSGLPSPLPAAASVADEEAVGDSVFFEEVELVVEVDGGAAVAGDELYLAAYGQLL